MMPRSLLAALTSARDWIRLGASRFNAAGLHFGHGTDNAVDEARSLVLHALHLDHDTPDMLLAGVLTPAERRDVLALLERRIAERRPAAYLTHRAWFAGLEFYVDERVLVPRSPIAELIGRGFAPWLGGPPSRILDLCTGSGSVAVVLRSARPNATVVGTDVDEVAVACARRNGVDALLGDLDGPVRDTLRSRVDVVTAVVPYVPADELHLLPRDVLEHEPRRAIDGGTRGTTILVRTVGAAARLLRPGGNVLLELGGDQASEIEPALTDRGFADVHVHRDDDGRDRAIEARLT